MLNVGVFTVIRVLKTKDNQNGSVADPVHFFSDLDPDGIFIPNLNIL